MDHREREVKISGNFSLVFGSMTFVNLRVNFNTETVNINTYSVPLVLDLNDYILHGDSVNMTTCCGVPLDM